MYAANRGIMKYYTKIYLKYVFSNHFIVVRLTERLVVGLDRFTGKRDKVCNKQTVSLNKKPSDVVSYRFLLNSNTRDTAILTIKTLLIKNCDICEYK